MALIPFCTISCCNYFMLHSFQAALCQTELFQMVLFHVYTHFILHSSMLQLFHFALFSRFILSCCISFMLHSSICIFLYLHSFHFVLLYIALFLCCHSFDVALTLGYTFSCFSGYTLSCCLFFKLHPNVLRVLMFLFIHVLLFFLGILPQSKAS